MKLYSRICEYCGDKFLTTNKTKIYCTKKCRNEKNIERNLGQRKEYINYKCLYCGKHFVSRRPDRKYCSKECARKYTTLKRCEYFEWTMLKEYCLEKYDYKCAECGYKDELECHHIKPISIGGSNDIENLVILCPKCHLKKHEEIRKEIMNIKD